MSPTFYSLESERGQFLLFSEFALISSEKVQEIVDLSETGIRYIYLVADHLV